MRYAVVASVAIGQFCTIACGQNGEVTRQDQPAVQIDHVIVAVSDLQQGMQQIEQMTGVRPVIGGEHPGRGTQNALIALGPRQYLEILAPQTDAELPDEVSYLVDLDSVTPMGFAVSTTDIESTIASLQESGYATSDPEAGSRARPDGVTLSWNTTFIEDPALGSAPFFISWDSGSAHPATTSPEGCELTSLAVIGAESGELTRLFGVLQLGVAASMSDSATPVYEVTLECPAGTVVLK
jgi:hypothetical protein